MDIFLNAKKAPPFEVIAYWSDDRFDHYQEQCEVLQRGDGQQLKSGNHV